MLHYYSIDPFIKFSLFKIIYIFTIFLNNIPIPYTHVILIKKIIILEHTNNPGVKKRLHRIYKKILFTKVMIRGKREGNKIKFNKCVFLSEL